MRELLFVFQDVEDPRRGTAKRHDLHEATGASRSAPRASATTWTGCKSATTGPASRTARRAPTPVTSAQRQALR